jgi:uncharacterized membrane protein YbhN (UPF0104 family)
VESGQSREEFAPPPELDRSHVGRRLLGLAVVLVIIVSVITLVPGLESFRERLSHAKGGWLALGAVLKVLSGVCYVAVFRGVFCSRMSWRISAEIGLAELGANAVVPTAGAGGLALGAWALHRGGMNGARIARRSVAFFFLTSLPNVLGVIALGVGLAAGAFAGRASLALSVVPAAIAAAAVALTVAGGRWAGAAERRLSRRDDAGRRLAHVLGALSGGVEEALLLLRRPDPWLIGGLVGYLAFDVMILWAGFHAFGSSPALAIVWIGYLIGELGGLIPVPGGVGGVDLGLIGTLVLYHVSLGSAIAAVLAYRALALLVPALLGAVAFVLLRRSLAREALAISNCAPGEQLEIIGAGSVQMPA